MKTTKGIIPFILENCDKPEFKTKPINGDDFLDAMLNVDLDSKPRGMWWEGKYYDHFPEELAKKILKYK